MTPVNHNNNQHGIITLTEQKWHPNLGSKQQVPNWTWNHPTRGVLSLVLETKPTHLANGAMDLGRELTTLLHQNSIVPSYISNSCPLTTGKCSSSPFISLTSFAISRDPRGKSQPITMWSPVPTDTHPKQLPHLRLRDHFRRQHGKNVGARGTELGEFGERLSLLEMSEKLHT